MNNDSTSTVILTPKGFKKQTETIDGKTVISFIPEKSNKPFDYKNIKTFEDACERLGISSELPFIIKLENKYTKRLIANYKLQVIFEAINNGWVADWSNSNQYKYYPYFKFQQTRGASGSFGFSYYTYVCDYSYALVGSCLCTDSSEKVEYIGKQFEDLYNDWLL